MKRKNKDLKRFREKLVLLEPQEFLGIVRLLDVKTVVMNESEPEIRDFADVLADCFAAFDKLPKKRKNEFLFILEEATKEEEDGSED